MLLSASLWMVLRNFISDGSMALCISSGGVGEIIHLRVRESRKGTRAQSFKHWNAVRTEASGSRWMSIVKDVVWWDGFCKCR